MDPFEYGFFREGCLLQGNWDESLPPVDPEIGCSAQAVREVLIDAGLSPQSTAALLLKIVGRIHCLQPRFRQRRRTERQMVRAISRP